MSMNKVIQQLIRNTPVKNLLDNSNFLNPVNQRAKTNYSGSGYTIDRWRTWDNDATLSISSNGITLNKNMWQYVNDKVKDGNKIYTIAVKTSDGVIEAYSGKFSGSFGGARVWANTDINNGYYCFCLASGFTFEWAALYEGEFTKETLPIYQPKDYAEELRTCQRYFYKNSSSIFPCAGSIFNATEVRINYPLPVPMRTIPTIDTTGINLNNIDVYITTNSGSVKHPSSIVVRGYGLNQTGITLGLVFDSAVGTAGTPATARFNSTFSLNADL